MDTWGSLDPPPCDFYVRLYMLAGGYILSLIPNGVQAMGAQRKGDITTATYVARDTWWRHSTRWHSNKLPLLRYLEGGWDCMGLLASGLFTTGGVLWQWNESTWIERSTRLLPCTEAAAATHLDSKEGTGFSTELLLSHGFLPKSVIR